MGHACEWETSMMLHLARGLVGDLSQIEAVSPRMPFEPASQGWITQDRSASRPHRRPTTRATAAKGQTLFRVVFPRRRHLSRASDRLGWPFPGWVRWTGADRQRSTEKHAASLRTWAICVLMLLATMLNYMDRLALSQQATEISQRAQSHKQGLRRHRGRIWNRFRDRRRCHGTRRGPDQPAVALSGGAACAGRSSDMRPAGSQPIASCLSAEFCSAFSRPASGRARWSPPSACCRAATGRWATASSRAAHRWARSPRRSSCCTSRLLPPAAGGFRSASSVRPASPGWSPGWPSSARATCSSRHRAMPGSGIRTMIRRLQTSAEPCYRTDHPVSARRSSAGFSPWGSW